MEQIPLYAPIYIPAPPQVDPEEHSYECSLMPTLDDLRYLCGDDEDLRRVVIIDL
jgi:hypothetical protein